MKVMIKIFQFFGSHPIYESLAKYPPEGVVFVNKPEENKYKTLSIYKPTFLKTKEKLKFFLHKLGLPRLICFPYTFNADLIHSSRGFLPLNKMPWVVDVEHVGSFGAFSKERVKKITLRFLFSPSCKKVLPHSNASLYSLINAWKIKNNKLKEKIEVLYPAITPRKKKLRKSQEKVVIGFQATRDAFYEKGGRELIEAFKILSKRYDQIELWLKSKVPLEIKKEVKSYPIRLIKNYYPTREDLFKKFYEKLDVFALPTYVDSFRYSLLEAMSTSLPIVATDIFAIPEIVEDGKNGFLIHSPLSDFDKNYIPKFFDRNILKQNIIKPVVKQLVEKLSLLIEDSSLRRKMGRYGRRLVEKGKFSIKERNKKLKRIYEEALGY